MVPRSTRVRFSIIDRRKEPIEVFKGSFAAQDYMMVLLLILLWLIATGCLTVFSHCFSNYLLFKCPDQ